VLIVEIALCLLWKLLNVYCANFSMFIVKISVCLLCKVLYVLLCKLLYVYCTNCCMFLCKFFMFIVQIAVGFCENFCIFVV
jgi:hypothetical protein